jgi:hypothetical protein
MLLLLLLLLHAGPDSATVLRLKGLQTPKGKHLRFTEDIGTSV